MPEPEVPDDADEGPVLDAQADAAQRVGRGLAFAVDAGDVLELDHAVARSSGFYTGEPGDSTEPRGAKR